MCSTLLDALFMRGSQILLGIGEAFSFGQRCGNVVFVQEADKFFQLFLVFRDNQIAIVVDRDRDVVLFGKLGVKVVGYGLDVGDGEIFQNFILLQQGDFLSDDRVG